MCREIRISRKEDKAEATGHVSEASQPDFSDLKEDVEALIRSSVAAGYQLAVRNFDVFAPPGTPIPVIEWDGAEPTIVDYEQPLEVTKTEMRARRTNLRRLRDDAKTQAERHAINHEPSRV